MSYSNNNINDFNLYNAFQSHANRNQTKQNRVILQLESYVKQMAF